MTSTLIPSECNVALLCGGRSGERQISLNSGEGAKGALLEAGFPVTVLDPAEPADLKRLVDGGFDVAFLCTHGRYGEDGTLQGFLELIDLPYTGSGVWGSALAINKAKAKIFYSNAGLHTPDSVTVYRGQDVDVPALVDVVGEHCVVKAASEGSTLGIFIAENQSEIGPAIQQAFEYDSEVVVERYVKGDEFTIAVMGNDDPEALPVVQIIPQNGFYDFEAKYAPGGSEHLCPAPISESLTHSLQEQAVAAHKALGCRGVSRTDFIVDDSGTCWVLETNTLPGMTKTSLLPDAGRAAGMSFPQICTKLIELALEGK
ncbi:MAG: D-alanine--D-alanine ligase [Coriobacteriia bacterium]|nr:D-alanine--D-alanine ligase [Coriobacteriia bacterium]